MAEKRSTTHPLALGARSALSSELISATALGSNAVAISPSQLHCARLDLQCRRPGQSRGDQAGA
ncbi:MAG: hypothetical protein WAL41_29580, partial [Mycobacterium sp.]